MIAKRVYFGVIGPGQIADEHLVPALKTVPGATFWSVLSRDVDRAAAFALRHDAQSKNASYTELDAFLADPDLDAVIIATPDRLHASLAVACAKAGKHVFVEKPMATSIAESYQMLAAVAAAKVKLAVGYHLRFHAGHQAVLDKIRKDFIGELLHMRVCWASKSDPSNWRAQEVTGRWWSLGATGTHALDLVRWFMQTACGEIVELKSLVTKSQFNGPHDETAVVSMRLRSGATAEVISSVLFDAPRVVEIFGSKGSVICTGTLGAHGAGDIFINNNFFNNRRLEYCVANPYWRELKNFVDSINGGTLQWQRVDGVEGAANVALLERVIAGY